MLPSDIRDKNILISPLNWGMGHVARCIPLIDLFLKNNNNVFVAGNRSQLSIMDQYFNDIHWIVHEGYPFNFGNSGSFRYDLIKRFPSLVSRWISERTEVERYCQDYAIDVVVSDHRYGFRSRRKHSIFLTHQVQLPLLRYERILQHVHHYWMRQFNEVWILDDEQINVAGKLSKPEKVLNYSYIGIQSRFMLYEKTQRATSGTVIVVSGPLSCARQYATEQAAYFTKEQITMIIPEELFNLKFPQNINVIVSNDWKKCDEVILGAEKIISRSGYSTLMDLVELKVPFSITPTPGQTEQKYLCDYWISRNARLY